MSDLSLHVRDRAGNIFGVIVDSDATVDTIFRELEGLTDVEGSNLSFNGQQLERDDELGDTGVCTDDVLDLVEKPVTFTWTPFDPEQSEYSLTEGNTVIINRNTTTRNWDAHTLPTISLLPTGTTVSFVAQCMYEPSWTTSIGVTAEGVKAGRGSEEMAQVSIGEKGVVQWDNDALAEHQLKEGSRMEFAVESTPFTGNAPATVNVNIYAFVDGERVHGKTCSFTTSSRKIMLSCYCYAPGQGWRILNP